LNAKFEPDAITAQGPGKLLAQDANKNLPGLQTSRDIGTDGTLANPCDQTLNNRQGNVRFQQRHTHIANSVLNIVVR
jgi:hypothetical protein